MMVRARRPKSGVTLLELLLALALTGVIMILIGMAIELNLRTLDSQRTDVERAQLARAILRHFAADLHNAILYEPIEMGGVPQMAAGGLSAEGGEFASDEFAGDFDSGSSGSGSSGGSSGSGSSGGSSSSSLFDDSSSMLEADGMESTLDIAGSVAPRSVPGLFGSQSELQVDISRLPRVDQFQQAMMAAEDAADGTVVDIPSDVKTVAYFLQIDALGGSSTAAAGTSSGAASVALDGSSEASATGLVRRELDRAVTAYASQNGGLDTSATSGQMLAPEVNYLEFRYFDGLEWVTEWDSQASGGLPVAVEITIGIDPMFGLDPASTEAARVQELALTDMTDYTYRLVVRLPAARPVAMSEESLEVLGL